MEQLKQTALPQAPQQTSPAVNPQPSRSMASSPSASIPLPSPTPQSSQWVGRERREDEESAGVEAGLGEGRFQKLWRER